MKKYSMKTRMGRARRRQETVAASGTQFNPHTLLQHSQKWIEEQRRTGLRRDRRYRVIR